MEKSRVAMDEDEEFERAEEKDKRRKLAMSTCDRGNGTHEKRGVK